MERIINKTKIENALKKIFPQISFFVVTSSPRIFRTVFGILDELHFDDYGHVLINANMRYCGHSQNIIIRLTEDLVRIYISDFPAFLKIIENKIKNFLDNMDIEWQEEPI
jgi:hypothetical protein